MNKLISKYVVLLGITVAANPVLAQTCQFLSITQTAPDSRYNDNLDGTITDVFTGLTWKKCSEGQTYANGTCSGSLNLYTWESAIGRANVNNINGGYANATNWRLPNVKELTSLTEKACSSPSINEKLFPNTGFKEYWSSSPDVNNTSYAWYVEFDFSEDFAFNKGKLYLVRMVKSY